MSLTPQRSRELALELISAAIVEDEAQTLSVHGVVDELPDGESLLHLILDLSQYAAGMAEALARLASEGGRELTALEIISEIALSEASE